MPVVPVNPSGSVLFYHDSGVPSGGRPYTTIVILHGLAIHAGSFLPMFPYAAANDQRLIAVQLRDYPQSTPYSVEELGDLRSTQKTQQEKALHAHGLELAVFLSQLIVTQDIPAVQVHNGKRAVSDIPAQDLDILRSHMRTVVLYDPPSFTVGVSPPNELTSRLATGSADPAERARSFLRVVSTFYTPQDDLTSDISTLSLRTPMGDAFVPTCDLLSSEQIAGMVHYEALGRLAPCLGTLDSALLRANVERALCKDVFPDVDILVLWCNMSPSPIIYGVKTFADRVMQMQEERREMRKVRFVKVEGANHTIHIHEPERFATFLAEQLG